MISKDCVRNLLGSLSVHSWLTASLLLPCALAKVFRVSSSIIFPTIRYTCSIHAESSPSRSVTRTCGQAPRISIFSGRAYFAIKSSSLLKQKHKVVGKFCFTGTRSAWMSGTFPGELFLMISNTLTTSSLEHSIPNFFPMLLKDNPRRLFLYSSSYVIIGLSFSAFRGTIPRLLAYRGLFSFNALSTDCGYAFSPVLRTLFVMGAPRLPSVDVPYS